MFLCNKEETDLNLLIKPVSGACSLRCGYCFYCDLTDNREIANYGKMSDDTLRRLIENAYASSDEYVSFAFQGGEPTLAGLDFYRRLVFLQQELNTKQLPVYNSIQTNGTAIDGEWADFLYKNKFLVGLSLDGTSDVHNRNRDGSFSQAMKAVDMFKKYNVRFNILCVVTKQTVTNVSKIYNFFKKHGFGYIQFIPCLDGIYDTRGTGPYSLTPELYGSFLRSVFDLWYRDFLSGSFPIIRHIDNYIGIIAGHPAENCAMRGVCSCNYVVESDGSVYPCDFYVLDEYKIGDVSMPFKELGASEAVRQFIGESEDIPDKCRSCEYYRLCKNGCRRDRDKNLNYYCSSYISFFEHALERMRKIAAASGKMRFKQ